MIMRKIAALVFVFLLCMVVTACGGDDKKTVLADGSYIIKASQGGVDMEQHYDKDGNLIKEITKEQDGTYREHQYSKDGSNVEIAKLTDGLYREIYTDPNGNVIKDITEWPDGSANTKEYTSEGTLI